MRSSRPVRTEDVAVNAAILGHHGRPFQAVLQFSDVARPVVLHQQTNRAVAHLERSALTPGDACVEELSQLRQVFQPVPQRRHEDRHDVEPIVEVFAELARFDLFFQVAIGRGDEADIDRQRLGAADALELSFLQDAQQLGLKRRGNLADLIEEQSAAVGLLEAAEPMIDGSGERPLLVSEQLGLQQADPTGRRS